MPWSETLLIIEDFEGAIIDVPIYGTGEKYGDGWIYGGTYDQSWLRPVHIELFPSLTEDFEDPNWVPPTWVEGSALESEDFENSLWLRPTFTENSMVDEDFEFIDW